MKNLLLGIAACSLTLTTFAQDPFVCGTDEVHRHLLETDPDYAQRRAEYEADIQQLIRDNAKMRDGHLVVTIPVVFHILHLGGKENVSDAQIHDQLAILNRDFRKLNPDVNTAIQHFQDIAADTYIEFALPTIDPLGQCTNGIDRIYSVETFRGREESKIHPWPRARYLNVWVVLGIESGAAGYTFKPGALEGFNQIREGIIIRHDYFGSIGTGIIPWSRALTHEVGHYFNLDHTWGGNNEPEQECGDDGVQDTPITRGHLSCQNRLDYQCSSTPINSTFDFFWVPSGGGNVDPTPAPVATAATLDTEANIGFSSVVPGQGGNVDVTPQPVIYIQGIAGAALTFEPFTAVNLSANPHAANEFAFSEWETGGNINTNKYYEFSYYPQAGFGFNADEMRFSIRRTMNGPRKFAVRTGPDFSMNEPITVNSSNASITNGIGTINDGFPGWIGNVKLDLAGEFDPNSAVTIRIYGWDADAPEGIMSINNVQVFGETYHESLAFSPFTATGVSAGSLVEGEFAFSNWSTGAEPGLTDPAELTGSQNDTQFYEVTIASKPEIAMNAQQMTFKVRRSEDGPRTFAVRREPFTGTNLAITASGNTAVTMLSGNRGFFTQDVAGDWVTITVNLGTNADLEAPISLRFYAWNAESEAGYFSIDDVNVQGTFGIIENLENYMEYAYCQKMFTEGQSDRMRAALTSPVGQRSTMWTANTLQVTGIADGYQIACAPKADFFAVPGNEQGVFTNPVIPYPPLTCANTNIMFKDNSSGAVPTSWSWTFQDGDPATSTEQNPIITFTQPGWKQVTLTVSNDLGEDTKTSPYDVYIGSPEVAMQGLASYSFEEPVGTWPFIYENYEGNHTMWRRYEGGGNTGNACIFLNSGDRDLGDYIDQDNAWDYDDLISPLLDLTGVQDATLSFWYSYSTQTTTLADATERLQVQRSNDCGRTWTALGSDLTGATLITNGNSTTPASWQFRSYNIPAALLTTNVRFRWRFISSTFSNNLFLDDINIGGPVGIADATGNALMTIHPNPTNDHFFVQMTGMDVHATEVTLLDSRGAIVYNKMHSPQGGNGILLSSRELGLAEGLYVIRVSNNEGTSAQKLMVGR